MNKVLVTALSTMNSTTIVSELRKSHESLYIIGADINPRQSIANSPLSKLVHIVQKRYKTVELY